MNNYLVKERSSHSTTFLQSAATAKAMINAAEREAAALIIAAEKEAEEIVRLAKTTAVEEKERQETRVRLSTLLAWRNAVANAKEDLLRLTEQIASSILIDEISNNPDSILRRIETANELIEDQIGLTLEVSEPDGEWIKSIFEKVNSNFSLQTNSNLQFGEFRLKSKWCQISSSPFYHLRSLLKEFGTSASTFKQLIKNTLTDGHVQL